MRKKTLNLFLNLIFFLSLAISIGFAYLVIAYVSSPDVKFPYSINGNLTVDQKEESLSTTPFKEVHDREGSIFVYLFYDGHQNLIQKIYGAEAENYAAFYDMNNDRIPEFFVFQEDYVVGTHAPMDVICYKWLNDKYILWKILTPAELPFQLDIKFHSLAWFSSFGLALLSFPITLIGLIYYGSMLIARRKRRQQN